MTEKQIKTKKLLETTKVLSDTERQEWLSLLPLMNDKQLLELEELINAPQTPAPIAEKKVEIPPVATPPPKIVSTQRPMDMSYINQDPRIQTKPEATNATPVVQQSSSTQTKTESGSELIPKTTQKVPESLPFTLVETKNETKSSPATAPVLPKTPLTTSPEHPLQTIAPVTQQGRGAGVVNRPLEPGEMIAPPIPSPNKPHPDTSQYKPTGAEAKLPKSAQDVMALTPQIVKSGNFSEVVQHMQKLAASWGYYNFYFLIRKSPLFTAYIQFGSQTVDSKQTTAFTSQEFTVLVDTFLSLRKLA